jgi:hypothetical protein
MLDFVAVSVDVWTVSPKIISVEVLTCANVGLIKLNKFISKSTENFYKLFYYYYSNNRYDTSM